MFVKNESCYLYIFTWKSLWTFYIWKISQSNNLHRTSNLVYHSSEIVSQNWVIQHCRFCILWPVRRQKEDMEKEKVNGTNVLKNRTYIQKVLVEQVEVSVWKLWGSTAGRKSLWEWIGLAFMKEEEFIIM